MSDDQVKEPEVAPEGGGVEESLAAYEERDDQKLFEIAKGIHGGTIFTSMQVRDQCDLPLVFMVLSLAGPETIEELKRDGIQVLYAYYSEAGPRGINGYPIFMSCSVLNGNEWNKIVKYIKRIEETLSAIEPKSTGEENAELDAIHAEREESRQAT